MREQTEVLHTLPNPHCGSSPIHPLHACDSSCGRPHIRATCSSLNKPRVTAPPTCPGHSTHHLIHLLKLLENVLFAVKLPQQGTSADERIRVKLYTTQSTTKLCRRRGKMEVGRVRGWLCQYWPPPLVGGVGGGGACMHLTTNHS